MGWLLVLCGHAAAPPSDSFSDTLSNAFSGATQYSLDHRAPDLSTHPMRTPSTVRLANGFFSSHSRGALAGINCTRAPKGIMRPGKGPRAGARMERFRTPGV